MRRAIFVYGNAVVGGVLVGVASLAAALYTFPAWGVAHNGGWTIDTRMGSPAAGPYSRAWMSLFGSLAVVPEGAAYYLAYQDDSGAPLDSRCTYTVSGRDLDAGWWSITVYGPTGYLLSGVDGRYSLTRDTVPRKADGSFSFTLAGSGTAAAAAPGAIPTGTERFNLELRVYGPGPAVLADLARAAVPQITREACA